MEITVAKLSYYLDLTYCTLKCLLLSISGLQSASAATRAVDSVDGAVPQEAPSATAVAVLLS